MTPAWEQAALDGDLQRLEELRAAGEDVDQLDRYGQTALMVCSREGQDRSVEWLVEHGADLDHTAKYGLSAVMLAAINGHDGIVRVLAAAGADLDIRGTGPAGFSDKTAEDLTRARSQQSRPARTEERAGG